MSDIKTEEDVTARDFLAGVVAMLAALAVVVFLAWVVVGAPGVLS